MNDLMTGYHCSICDRDFFNKAETQVTVERKEYANDKTTKTIWQFRVCDECLEKLGVKCSNQISAATASTTVNR